MIPTREFTLGLVLLTAACQAPGSGQADRSGQTAEKSSAVIFATIGGIT